LEPLAREIGAGLRRAREARRLTLRDVAAVSGDRFKATSVASYERGERAISVVRFCELCRFYGVRPDRLLGEIVRSVAGAEEPVIDIAILESLGSEEAALVSGFVQQVRALRGEVEEETIVLRAGDLEVLATAAGSRANELADLLRTKPGRPDEPQ
jgi:transcriptional regulator with XRE-family HTH domain